MSFDLEYFYLLRLFLKHAQKMDNFWSSYVRSIFIIPLMERHLSMIRILTGMRLILVYKIYIFREFLRGLHYTPVYLIQTPGRCSKQYISTMLYVYASNQTYEVLIDSLSCYNKLFEKTSSK